MDGGARDKAWLAVLAEAGREGCLTYQPDGINLQLRGNMTDGRFSIALWRGWVYSCRFGLGAGIGLCRLSR